MRRDLAQAWNERSFCVEKQGASSVRFDGMYRCEAVSIAGFIQQLAVCYIRHGYWFYVTGIVPAGKDPKATDDKLVALYDIDVTKWARAWRKALGQASMQYLRYNRFFILLATHGEHSFFEREAASMRDCRRVPVKFFGYSISYRGGHPCVRVEQGEYLRVKAYFEDLATRRTSAQLGAELGAIGWIPYAPVRRQLFGVLRAVNGKRRAAGLGEVSHLWLNLERRIMAPFGETLANQLARERTPTATDESTVAEPEVLLEDPTAVLPDAPKEDGKL